MSSSEPAAAPVVDAAAPAKADKEVVLGEDGQPLSKGEIKRRAKEAEKEKKRIEREAKEAKEKAARAAADVDYSAQNYGKLPLNQSQERTGIKRIKFATLSAANDGEPVQFRARIQTSRAQGAKMVFLVFRQQSSTIQALIQVDADTVSKKMVRFAESIPSESIVTVEGFVQKPLEPVKTCTVQDAEVKITKLFVVSEAPQKLPFILADASRAAEDFENAGEGVQYVDVELPTRLDNRVLDLRVVANQAIFKMSSGVCQLFREYLNSQGFIEIHSPKLQGAATESGASVFTVNYFKGKAFLAQSPQLAKQMCIAADMEKVYEIGPVFRAEDSNTHRHMTEFTGLDLEMAFEEHYHEVMFTIDAMLKHIFKGLTEGFADEIKAVQRQHPADNFTWLEETLVLSYKDAIGLLREGGVDIEDEEDMNTEKEKFLGKLVKAKYNTDYYIVDKFPLALRPFYTMPDATNPALSNSYDFFMRGEEILSGAQRVHDAPMLEERMKAVGIQPEDMKAYVDAFRLAAPPHAGGGIGLERVVMLFLKLGNIRRASLFPRDPKRLSP